jgi:hypothetical protein
MINYLAVKFTDGGTLICGDTISISKLEESGYPDEVGIEEITIHHTDGTKSTFVPE